jgi:hypothetical protein
MLRSLGPDSCLTCDLPLEIVSIKFRVRGVQALSVCPNCGVASADNIPPLLTPMLKRWWATRSHQAKISDLRLASSSESTVDASMHLLDDCQRLLESERTGAASIAARRS